MSRASVSWEILVVRIRQWRSAVLLTVVEWTVRLFALLTWPNATLWCLVANRVVLKLFPAVTMPTPVLKAATFIVGASIPFGFPTAALGIPVLVEMRWSSVVLPVVCVYTLVSLVFFVAEGTPDCLEVEHIKIIIYDHFVELGHWQLRVRMSKCTHISIVALIDFVRKGATEFCLILLWMVELLDTVVTFTARESVNTSFRSRYWKTQLANIPIRYTSLILCLCFVEVQAFLRVVCLLIFAWQCLELHQVQQLDDVNTLAFSFMSFRTCTVRLKKSSRAQWVIRPRTFWLLNIISLCWLAAQLWTLRNTTKIYAYAIIK